MGDIFIAGITHYPPLAGPDESMAWILKRMLQNPALPEKYRDRRGWPVPMREEWGTDEGAAAAKRHRASHLTWFNKVRAALDAFEPDLVVLWGDDQYENFREEIVPPYCIYAHESFAFSPPPKNIWNEPPDKKFQAKGHVRAAKYLTSRLIECGFDTAYSYKPLHHPLGRLRMRSCISTTIAAVSLTRLFHSRSIVMAGG